MKGFFSDYREAPVKIPPPVIKIDDNRVEHMLAYERCTIEWLYQFGIAFSLQLFCCVTAKLYFKNVSIKKFKDSLRKLKKDGYISDFELSGCNNKIYILTEKGIDYSSKRFNGKEERSKAMLKVLKACEGKSLPDIFYEQLVINQFIASSVSTVNVVSRSIMISMDRIELPEQINVSYLPAYVRIALPRGASILPEKNRNGLQSARTVTVFPLVLKNDVLDEQCLLIGKQLYAIEEYTNQLGITNYLVIVVVPEHYAAELVHERMSGLGDRRVVGHFYLLEDDMFYAPYSNLFSISNGKINQFNLF